MCVILSIPKFELAKYPGIDFQKDLVAEIVKIEEKAAVFYEECFNYNINRARLIAEAGKYPSCINYSNAVAEFDERFLKKLKLSLIKGRDYLIALHDVITKNENFIKCPHCLIK
ncbi:unnamed protein product [Chironomus riparius]|uniref:Proteasome activator PA28 C-terminal domain-containing protein n=1 Tax=Chironomus riparius TaxID=315576 RepID=A0A9N9S071_9DIPT|nr:unnamed protein product [Chironomus riparius]